MTKAFNLIPAPKFMLSLLGIVVIGVAVAVIALVIKVIVTNTKEGFEYNEGTKIGLGVVAGIMAIPVLLVIVLALIGR
jgi:hypothetical protein